MREQDPPLRMFLRGTFPGSRVLHPSVRRLQKLLLHRGRPRRREPRRLPGAVERE